MRRREFIAGLGGAAAWPLSVRAQSHSVPSVGFLHASAAERGRDVVASFEDGLKQTSYVPGENITIEYRWAEDSYERLPKLAQDLADRRVSVILAATPVAALAAKGAVGWIPIVFCVGSDPVKDGLVSSLRRPTGNITGTTFFADLLSAKRLELLSQLARGSKLFGVMVNPNNPNSELEIRDAREAAQSLNVNLILASARTESDIGKAFMDFKQGQSVAGLLVASDAFLNLHAKEIADFALRDEIPTCFSFRETAVAGGLMSYGANRLDAYRRAGNLRWTRTSWRKD